MKPRTLESETLGLLPSFFTCHLWANHYLAAAQSLHLKNGPNNSPFSRWWCERRTNA